MKLPPGVSEADALAAIETTVRILAPTFTFGIYSLDDIKQEARIMGMECLPRYEAGGYGPDGEPVQRLDNFLYRHIRNRLINLKRNKYRRNDPPCLLCHQAEGKRSGHPGGEFCKKYLAWKARNEAKASLMSPVDLDRIPDERQRPDRLASEVEEECEANELLRLIDEKLSVELRATYLQMRAGKSVPKARRTQVEAAVREILGMENA